MKRKVYWGVVIGIGVPCVVYALSYIFWTQSLKKTSYEFRNSIIPMASFSGETVEEAAKELWRLTAIENPHFADKELIIDLPAAQKGQPYTMQLAHCPSSEWFNYLCQASDSKYCLNHSKLILSPISAADCATPTFFVLAENIHFVVVESWWKLKRMFHKPEPGDPFATSFP